MCSENTPLHSMTLTHVLKLGHQLSSCLVILLTKMWAIFCDERIFISIYFVLYGRASLLLNCFDMLLPVKKQLLRCTDSCHKINTQSVGNIIQ